MANIQEIVVRVHNLTLRGTVHAKGDHLRLDVDLPSTQTLLSEGLISLRPIPTPSSVDKPAKIQHNSPINSKTKGGRNGRKRNSKSRSVRTPSEAVPEGLSGAESSD